MERCKVSRMERNGEESIQIMYFSLQVKRLTINKVKYYQSQI